MLVIALICACLVVLRVESNQPVDGATQNGSQNATRLQARILLETKNLDIDEKSYPPSSNETSQESAARNQPTSNSVIPKASNNSTSIVKTKRKIKKERSNRRLSNIWSMFLPSSSSNSDNDYEESFEGEETNGDEQVSTIGGSETANKQMPPKPAPINPAVRQNDTASTRAGPNSAPLLLAGAIEKHDEQLVAKYSRPPRQEGGSGLTTQVRLPSDSSSWSSFNGSSGSMSTGKLDSEPVQLITGALSKDVGSSGPNMNDIVSNIMNSMGSAPSNDTNKISSSTEMEEEEENQIGGQATAKSGPATSTTSASIDNNNFERWLNRIQFQEATSSTAGPQTTTASDAEKRPPSEFGLWNQTRQWLSAVQDANNTLNVKNIKWPSSPSIRRDAQNSSATTGQQMQPEVSRLVEALADMNRSKLLFRGTQRPTKTSHSDTKGGQVQRLVGSTKSGAQADEHQAQAPPRYQQHPFQQHLRQQQAQLVHGIKYPLAQASTISVSTQDGSSNTSLSFAPNFAMNPNSLSNEMSQVVNSSSSSALMGSSDEGNSVEQSVYQSQDEILRQVTSAINAEQRLNHKSSEAAHNHRHSGDPIMSNNQDQSDLDSLSKMFKVGSSNNEQTADPLAPGGTSTTTSAPSSTTSSKSPLDLLKASLSGAGSNSNQSSVLGMDDIDKSFDLLAEKLRQFALRQQQASTNGDNQRQQQPSWLISRKPDLMGQTSANLSSLASSLASNGGSGSSVTINQLRELLSKHERNKNELKSSQESMMLLMQQLLQANGGDDKSNQLDKQSSSHLIQQRRENTNGNSANGNTQTGTTLLTNDELNQISDELAANNTRNQPDANKPPAGVSNIGWTPVMGPAEPNGGSHSGGPLLSPANLIKNRFKQPAMVISQQKDNVGTGKDFVDDEYFMNNLAMMFASSQANGGDSNNEVQTDDRGQIVGLPIAILKDNEEIELPQLEAAAAAVADQLNGNSQSVMRSHNNFAPRLAPPLNGVSPGLGQVGEQLPTPAQLSQIQSILQGYSPQTFNGPFAQRNPMAGLGHSMAAPITREAQLTSVQRQSPGFYQSQQLHAQMQPLNNMASLIHESQNHHQPDHSPIMAAFEQSNLNTNQPVVQNHNSIVVEQNHVQPDLSPLSEPTDANQSQTRQRNPPFNQESARPSTLDSPVDSALKVRDYTRNNGLPISANNLQQHNQQRAYPPAQEIQQQHQLNKQLPHGGQSFPANDDFRLQRQQQQLAHQQVQQHYLNQPQTNLQMQTALSDYHQSMRSPQLVQGMNQMMTDNRPLPPPPMMTSTISGGGPPVRMREVSVYKPFGFRTHHSIAYQASPSVAAMFPGLAHPPTRPSILRHMTPFRAAYTEGQNLLRPLMPPQLAESLRQYHNHPLLNSFPLPPEIRHPYARGGQVKRHSHQPANWRAWQRAKLPANVYASMSKARAQHLDPVEIGGADDLNLADHLEQENLEEIKFMPMDSRNEPTVKEVDMHTMQRSLAGSEKKSRPGRQYSNYTRQFRGRHFDGPVRSYVDQPSVMPCEKPTDRPQVTSTTSTTLKSTEIANSTTPMPVVATTLLVNMTTSASNETVF